MASGRSAKQYEEQQAELLRERQRRIQAESQLSLLQAAGGSGGGSSNGGTNNSYSTTASSPQLYYGASPSAAAAGDPRGALAAAQQLLAAYPQHHRSNNAAPVQPPQPQMSPYAHLHHHHLHHPPLQQQSYGSDDGGAYGRYVSTADGYGPTSVMHQHHPAQPAPPRQSYELPSATAAYTSGAVTQHGDAMHLLQRLHTAESLITSLVSRCEALERRCGTLEKMQMQVHSASAGAGASSSSSGSQLAYKHEGKEETSNTTAAAASTAAGGAGLRPPSMDHRGGLAASVMIAPPPATAGTTTVKAEPTAANATPTYGALPGGKRPKGGANAAAAAAGASTVAPSVSKSAVKPLPLAPAPRAANASKSSDRGAGASAERFAVQHLGQVIPYHGPPEDAEAAYRGPGYHHQHHSSASHSTAASHVLGGGLEHSARRGQPQPQQRRAPSPSTLVGVGGGATAPTNDGTASRSIQAYQLRQFATAAAGGGQRGGVKQQQADSNTSSRSSSWHNQHTTQSPAPNDPLGGPEGYRGFTVSMLNEDEARFVSDAIRRIGRQSTLISVPTDQDLPDTVTHVVVREHPVSRKALCALVSGRTVVTLEYVRQSLSIGTWVDETQVSSAYRCFPAWPLERKKVLVAVPDQIMANSIRDVLRAGRAMVLTDNARGTGDVLILSSAEDLTGYIAEFY